MATKADPVEISAAGRSLSISSPDKEMFPGEGGRGPFRKIDLVNYYLAVGEAIMPTVLDRPTLLQRFPKGVGGQSFFQKRIPDTAPEWLATTTVATINGTESRALVMADLAHVIWAANQGCLGFHPWPFRAHSPGDTDELRIDLDPSPGVTFDLVREAAAAVKDLLDELGLVGFAKTSGNRGIHIYVPVAPGWDSFAVRQAAIGLGRIMQERRGDLMTVEWWKEDRGKRVFIDFNQNAPHKTVFGAWCVRQRVGAQVSAPFFWAELDTVVLDELTIESVPGRLAEQGDPWAEMTAKSFDIEPLVERYRSDLAKGIPDAPWPPVYPKMPDEARRIHPSKAKL